MSTVFLGDATFARFKPSFGKISRLNPGQRDAQPQKTDLVKIPIKLNIFRDIKKLKHRDLIVKEPTGDPSEQVPACLNPLHPGWENTTP